jgi:hypothetical protein
MMQVGREIRGPNRLIQTHMQNNAGLARPSIEQIIDYEIIKFGLGGGFGTLHGMKYVQAMAGSDCDNWKELLHDKYKQMESNNVFRVVPTVEVPPCAKVMTST